MSDPSAELSQNELDRRLEDAGFTPSVKMVAALVARIAQADDEGAKRATIALGRVQSAVTDRVARAMTSLGPTERSRVALALKSRVGKAEDAALTELLIATSRDDDARVRKSAARTLAKIGGDEAGAAIAAAIERSTSAPERRALERSLAASGAALAHEILSRSNASDDHPTAVKARLIAERVARRAAPSATATSPQQPSQPLRMGYRSALPILVTCRRGLEPTLLAEIRDLLGVESRPLSPLAGGGAGGYSRIAVDWSGPLDALATLRVALAFGATIEAPRAANEDPALSVAKALSAARVTDFLRRARHPGNGPNAPVRFRLAWADTKKHRASTWGVAAALRSGPLAGLASDLVNDPTDSDWDVVAAVEPHRVVLDLLPRVDDHRFDYRVREVPAASHPTVAAALARELGVQDRDVIWDPFVGSGLELCERARLGPYHRLLGSDIDEPALACARANTVSARLERVDLRLEDAGYSRVPLPVITGLVSNPPMGRRVLASGDLDGLLTAVITRAAKHLAIGGRIVLLSPRPEVTRRAALAMKLRPHTDRPVDMGGFDARLQSFHARK